MTSYIESDYNQLRLEGYEGLELNIMLHAYGYTQNEIKEIKADVKKPIIKLNQRDFLRLQSDYENYDYNTELSESGKTVTYTLTHKTSGQVYKHYAKRYYEI